MFVIAVLAAALAAGPQLVWVSLSNELKTKDTVQFFVDDEAKMRCEAPPDVRCEVSVEPGPHSFTAKRADDGSVCFVFTVQRVTANLKLKLKECATK